MKDLSLGRKRCLELSGIIREGREQMFFGMDTFRSSNLDTKGAVCSTTACIAGWAVCVYAPLDWRVNVGSAYIERIARELLGLSCNDANTLFYVRDRDEEDIIDKGRITPELAAAVLANYALTGEVDWSVHD